MGWGELFEWKGMAVTGARDVNAGNWDAGAGMRRGRSEHGNGPATGEHRNVVIILIHATAAPKKEARTKRPCFGRTLEWKSAQ